MISPEVLRRFPFFADFNSEQLKELAMLGEERIFESHETVFEQGGPAEQLYFLLEGCVDLFYIVRENFHSDLRHETMICEIAPGESFSISALIEPHILTATARTCQTSRVIAFDAEGLRKLCESDPHLESLLMRRVASTAMDRLHATRLQLAVAWS